MWVPALVLGVGQEEGRIPKEEGSTERDPRQPVTVQGYRGNFGSGRSAVWKFVRPVCRFEGRFGRRRRRNR